MYISLTESLKNGFKRWSDSHQRKYGRGDAEEGHGIVDPGADVASPGVMSPAHPPLLTAEKSL